jgi:hypothetical protein
MGRKPNSLENILAKTHRDADTGCLIYEGAVNEKGYARVSFNNKTAKASQVVYTLWYGSIPEGWEIDHTCYNRRCIERTHLRPLTHKENVMRTERYEFLRGLRLHILLAVYPQIECLPVTIASTDVSALWGCQSSKVSKLLHTMAEAYPDEFVWRSLRQGHQGRRPALFEIQIASSLVERLLSASQETVPTVEALVG